VRCRPLPGSGSAFPSQSPAPSAGDENVVRDETAQLRTSRVKKSVPPGPTGAWRLAPSGDGLTAFWRRRNPGAPQHDCDSLIWDVMAGVGASNLRAIQRGYRPGIVSALARHAASSRYFLAGGCPFQRGWWRTWSRRAALCRTDPGLSSPRSGIRIASRGADHQTCHVHMVPMNRSPASGRYTAWARSPAAGDYVNSPRAARRWWSHDPPKGSFRFAGHRSATQWQRYPRGWLQPGRSEAADRFARDNSRRRAPRPPGCARRL